MSTQERSPVLKMFRPIVEELASKTIAGATPTISNTLPGLASATAEILRHRLKGTPGARRISARLGKKERPSRFIVAPRAGQQSSGPLVIESLRQIESQLSEAIVHSEAETGPKLLNITETEALLLRERYSSLLVEEDVQLRLAHNSSPLIPTVEEPASLASGSKTSIVVTVTSGGFPVANASVILLTRKAQNRGYKATTDAIGRAKVAIRSNDKKFERVIVVPSGRQWSKVLDNIPVGSFSVDVLPVPVNGFDWGHVSCDAASRGSHLGKSVKIAVIDSGIGPHPSIKVAGGKSWVGGTWADGPERHGTHCAGVIAAVAGAGGTWGYAPEIELYSLRTFGGKDGGGYAYDIGNAVQWAIDEGCDIISMSFVHDETVGFLRQKIEKALGEGVLCVAAAGNEGGAVRFPASLEDVIGVSAIGKTGIYPSDSIHADAESSITRGDYFFASFSNFGPDIDFCAPGVAITSTVPAGDYAPWDGTSMACPHVAGIAALALNISPILKAQPRNAARLPIFIDVLRKSTLDLGFPKDYQGAGLPYVGKI